MNDQPSKLRPIGGGGRRTFSTAVDPTPPEVSKDPNSHQPPEEHEAEKAQPRAASSPRRRPSRAAAATPTRTRWDELERKEVRLREDQAAALTQLTRQIRRQARRRRNPDTEPERLTDNTLIRIGVDLLLARSGQLAGTTEAELRHSVDLNN